MRNTARKNQTVLSTDKCSKSNLSHERNVAGGEKEKNEQESEQDMHRDKKLRSTHVFPAPVIP